MVGNLTGNFGVILSSNSVLNSSTEIGTYSIPNAAIAIALNMPIRSGGKLFVLEGNISDRRIHVFIADTNIFFRYFNGTIFSEWINLKPYDYDELNLILNENMINHLSGHDLIFLPNQLDYNRVVNNYWESMPMRIHKDDILINCSTTQISYIHFYDKNMTYIDRDYTPKKQLIIPDNACYFAIAIAYPAASNLEPTVADLDNVDLIFITKHRFDVNDYNEMDKRFLLNSEITIGVTQLSYRIFYNNENSSYKSKIFKVNPGDKVLIAGLGGDLARLYTVFDENLIAIDVSAVDIVYKKELYTIPENGKFIIVQTARDRDLYCKILNSYHELKTFINIDEMIKNFKIEDDICLVYNDDTNFVDPFNNHPQYYQYCSMNGLNRYSLENGGYANIIPIQTKHYDNTKSINTIIDIAKSFTGVGLKYKSNSGPINATSQAQLGGIQCSQFVTCLFKGLYYQNSLFVTNSNTFLNILDPIPGRYLSANELALWMAHNGLLKKSRNLIGAMPGDILFFATNGSKYFDVDWEGIVHTAMLIARDNEDNAYFLQAGGETITSAYLSSDTTEAVRITKMANCSMNYTTENDSFYLYGYGSVPISFLSDLPESQLGLIQKFK